MTLFAVVITVLFWAGIVAGIVRSTFTSSPHWLGSKRLSKAYALVVIFFFANMIHGAGVPFLFGGWVFEYAIIAGIFAAFQIVLNAQEKSQVESDIAKDPRLKRCPKCKAVVDKIVAECPKCNNPIN